MVAGILEYAALVVFYSLLSTVTLESLLRLWHVQDPPFSVVFRLQTLLLPPVAPLLFGLLNPERGSEPFRRETALVDLHNWLGQEPSLSHPAWLLLIAAVGVTAVLLAATEVAGFLRRPRARQGLQPMSIPLAQRLAAVLDTLVARGLTPVPTLLLDQPDPAAYTIGLRRPAVVITAGMVEMLDDEELASVLAHEVAHVRRRHNWLGWLVFCLRLASFYNPVSLVTFHQIGHDIEKVCDRDAAAITGKPLALASALIKVYRTSYAVVGEFRWWSRPLARRVAALENRALQTLVMDRVERLVHSETAREVSSPLLRLGLAVSGVLMLAYLVV